MFELIDLPRLGLIFFLESVLSLDNVIAISLIIKHLNKDLQKKALWVGLGSALVLRLIATLGIAYFIHFKWLEFLGACYLIYLAFSFRKHPKQRTPQSFLRTLILIELTDLALAIDSIIAAVGIVGLPPKLWIVYVGGAMGMVMIRFAAQGFLQLTDRFPHLNTSAQGIVGLVGTKLLLEVFNLYPSSGDFAFFGLSALFLGLGMLPLRKNLP
jgi:YkoY family integral membrane protein